MTQSVHEGRSSKTRPYFPELDGIRALAALMVMVFHFGQDWYASKILVFGQTGVDLFFVLSGFLITLILLQAPHGDWHEIKNFYIRRTLRIFPLYYGYLVGACVLVGSMVSPWYWVYLQNMASSLRLVLNSAPLHGPGHFWSLGVEEQFYLGWPFLVLFLPRRWLSKAMWGTVIGAFLLRMILVHTRVDLFEFTFTRLDGLAAGGLLAYYYLYGGLIRFKSLFLCGLPMALLSLVVEKIASRGSGLAWVEVVKYSSATLLYVSVVGLILATADSWIHRLLRSSPMRALGRVSYGLYVYHPVIFAVLPRYLGELPILLKGAVCFAVSYLVALASFYGFEKQFTNLKDKFAKEKKFRAVTA